MFRCHWINNMSTKIGPITIIYEEKPQQCDDCGEIKELRPYGPDYSMVCFDCAMKDPVGAEIRMALKLFGDVITEEEARERLSRE